MFRRNKVLNMRHTHSRATHTFTCDTHIHVRHTHSRATHTFTCDTHIHVRHTHSCAAHTFTFTPMFYLFMNLLLQSNEQTKNI